jgi:hypothetical protein
MSKNKIHIKPPRRNKTNLQFGESGGSNIPNTRLDKYQEAQHGTIASEDIRINNTYRTKQSPITNCNSFPDEYDSFDIFGDWTTSWEFNNQGQSGTCVTAAFVTQLSYKLSEFLDFPIVIDYTKFLQDIYDLYYTHGVPQFGIFNIDENGNFSEPKIPIIGFGLPTYSPILWNRLTTYAFQYLKTHIPITVYINCNKYNKTPIYDTNIPFNLGFLARPINNDSSDIKCGIKISLQNWKKYRPSKICDIKNYILTKGPLHVSINNRLVYWLNNYASNGSTFDYDNDMPIVIGAMASFAFTYYNGGGHGVVLTGWTTPQAGYTTFLFRNSWQNKSFFKIRIKDSDYDNAITPVFMEYYSDNYEYDIKFVEYQKQSDEQIKNIIKSNLRDCCGVGTCCGDNFIQNILTSCEENITEIECDKKLQNIHSFKCDESYEENGETIIIKNLKYIPNRNQSKILKNNILNLDYLLIDDLILDNHLLQDIKNYKDTYQNMDENTLNAITSSLELRIIDEFNALPDQIIDCPCCPSPSPSVSPEPSPSVSPEPSPSASPEPSGSPSPCTSEYYESNVLLRYLPDNNSFEEEFVAYWGAYTTSWNPVGGFGGIGNVKTSPTLRSQRSNPNPNPSGPIYATTTYLTASYNLDDCSFTISGFIGIQKDQYVTGAFVACGDINFTISYDAYNNKTTVQNFIPYEGADSVTDFASLQSIAGIDISDILDPLQV